MKSKKKEVVKKEKKRKIFEVQKRKEKKTREWGR